MASCLTGLARLARKDGDGSWAALLLDAARLQDGLTRRVRDQVLAAEREMGLASPQRTPSAADARSVIEGLLAPTLDRGGIDDTA